MNHRKKLILASRSPRRKKLLNSMGLSFSISVSDVDETPLPDELPDAHARRVARNKARAIDPEDHIVIAADTIVVLGTRILGKPENEAQAIEMLKALSDRTHQVITAVCLRSADREQVFSVSTDVTFRPLTEQDIRAYVKTGEPMDKAGAYAIQGRAAAMVRAVNGSYTNVVGLPLCELWEALNSFA